MSVSLPRDSGDSSSLVTRLPSVSNKGSSGFKEAVGAGVCVMLIT